MPWGLPRGLFTIKLNSNGDFVWAKQISNPDGFGNEDSKSIEIDETGNVYIGGAFSYADFDPDPTNEEIISTGGSSNAFLLKLDVDGNYQWVKTMDSTGVVEIIDMEIDDSQAIYATGRFRNTVDLDPNAGTANFTSNGGEDIFLAKISSDGDYIWGQTLGGSGLDVSKTIKILPSGLYWGGMFSGTVDLDPTSGENTNVSNGPANAFLNKLDADGNYSYSYVLGGETSDFENVYDVTEAFNGNLFVTGEFNGTTDFDNSSAEAITISNGKSDSFLLEITIAGEYINHWSIGGDDTDSYPQIYFNDNNEALRLGAFRSTNMDFNPFAGEDIKGTAGFYDAYFSKYNLFNNGNDSCDSAIALACGDTIMGETINDTNSGGNDANDEFFSFTGNGTANLITVSLCGQTDFDTVLRIFEDCTLVNEIAVNDDFCDAQSEITFLSDGTSTYYIMVEGYNANKGNFTLTLTCEELAVNDDCENALPISCGETVSGTTTNASFDASAINCGEVEVTAPGVWYEFTDNSGLVTDYTISLCGGTDFDSKLTVYSGSCGALVCETANDDFCNLQSEVSFQGDWNTTYYILVHGYLQNTGDFSLNVDCSPVPPPNDRIVNAIDIDMFGFPYIDPAVAMPAATEENGNPAGCNLTGANGVWYKFTSNTNGSANAIIESPAGAKSVTFYSSANENATETDLTLVDQSTNQCVSGTMSSISTEAGQTYYIFVLNNGGITDIKVDASVLEIAENSLADFKFYPNPTKDIIKMKAYSVIENVKILNLLGQQVIDIKNNTNATEINISSLTSGTYILRVTVNGKVGNYKIIKN